MRVEGVGFRVWATPSQRRDTLNRPKPTVPPARSARPEYYSILQSLTASYGILWVLGVFFRARLLVLVCWGLGFRAL